MRVPIKSVKSMMWAVAFSALAVWGFQAWRRALWLENMANHHGGLRAVSLWNLEKARESLDGAGGSAAALKQAAEWRSAIAIYEAEAEYEGRRRDYLLRARFFPWLAIEPDPDRRPR